MFPAFEHPSVALPSEVRGDGEVVEDELEGNRLRVKLIAMDAEDVQVRDDVKIAIFGIPPASERQQLEQQQQQQQQQGQASSSSAVPDSEGWHFLCYMWLHTGFVAAEASGPGKPIPPVRLTHAELDRARGAGRVYPFKRFKKFDVAVGFEPVKSALAGGGFAL
jgi:hypothetical protein